MDSTWEHESDIANTNKINEYRMFNRALDKDSRNIMTTQLNRHKLLLELENNPKRKAKMGYN
jgi:chromodomain-helicase-DNA-binding protein 7